MCIIFAAYHVYIWILYLFWMPNFLSCSSLGLFIIIIAVFLCFCVLFFVYFILFYSFYLGYLCWARELYYLKWFIYSFFSALNYTIWFSECFYDYNQIFILIYFIWFLEVMVAFGCRLFCWKLKTIKKIFWITVHAKITVDKLNARFMFHEQCKRR